MSLRIHDEVEQWRTIPGHPTYEASSIGRVRSYRAHGGKRLLTTPYLRTLRTARTGYQVVGLQVAGKCVQFSVHRLVAAAFLGPCPDGLQVAHGDGNRLNNRLNNLRYATPLENSQDKQAHGTVARGEGGGRAKLTEDQVVEIKSRRRDGETQKSLAHSFGVSISAIQWILNGRNWAHLKEAA